MTTCGVPEYSLKDLRPPASDSTAAMSGPRGRVVFLHRGVKASVSFGSLRRGRVGPREEQVGANVTI